MGDGGVVLADRTGVGGLDGFLGGGVGVAVAVEVVLLLHGVAGDGVGTLLDGFVDALDDLLAGELGWLSGLRVRGEDDQFGKEKGEEDGESR